MYFSFVFAFVAPLTNRHDLASLGCFFTGPEELPVQSVSGGRPEDPHGDGPQLH